MEQFTYKRPARVRVSSKMEAKNEQGDTVFKIQKIQHKFFARIIHHLIKGGLPYSYKVTNDNGKPLYTVDCSFPGMWYIIIDHLSSEEASIDSYRVQLIEKGYRFKLNNHEFQFEKDHTGTGILTCDQTQVASVSIPINKDPSLFVLPASDTIIIRATTPEFASLAAVLFHTLFYYDA